MVSPLAREQVVGDRPPASSFSKAHLAPVPGTVHIGSKDIRSIPIKDIRLDSAYQRDLDTTRVAKLKRDWDERLAGVIILSHRGSNLWCLDGQHRLAVMRERGDVVCNAIVLEGLAQTEEAALFVKYNNNRKGLNAWDLFRADYTAQNPDVLAIVRVVNGIGYQLSQGPGPNHIQAISGVRRVFALGGEDLLRLTLQTIRSVWATDKNALSAQTMGGLALFYYAYVGEDCFEQTRLEATLERNAPMVFLRKAQEIQAERVSRGASEYATAEAIRLVYNQGLAPKNRLGTMRGLDGKKHPFSRPR